MRGKEDECVVAFNPLTVELVCARRDVMAIALTRRGMPRSRHGQRLKQQTRWSGETGQGPCKGTDC